MALSEIFLGRELEGCEILSINDTLIVSSSTREIQERAVRLLEKSDRLLRSEEIAQILFQIAGCTVFIWPAASFRRVVQSLHKH